MGVRGSPILRFPHRMNYNQISFWLFFLGVLAIYWRLDHRKQNAFMLAASYFFYGWWDWRFTILLFVSSISDFGFGLLIDRQGERAKRKRARTSTTARSSSRSLGMAMRRSLRRCHTGSSTLPFPRRPSSRASATGSSCHVSTRLRSGVAAWCF